MTSTEALRRALDAAYDLHRHRDPPPFAERLAEILAHAVRCDSALVVSVDVGDGTVEMAAWPREHFARLDRAEAVRLHAADHPFVAHCRASRSARAHRLSELAPREAFQRTSLHSKLYRFFGIEHQLLMSIPDARGRRRAVVLNRRGDDFHDDERATLEALWPHIALAERRRLAERRKRAPSLPDVTAESSAGVIVIDAQGAVALCSEPARLWLRDYFELLLPPGRRVALPQPLLQWARERLGAESLGRSLRDTRPDPFVLARGERCLVATLVVDHGKAQHLMRLEEVELNAPPGSLGALGLTAREAEVLSWVAQGKTNREIGLILGASARTVQKHLEHVFEKIGVESRTAAILRAWQAGRGAAPR